MEFRKSVLHNRIEFRNSVLLHNVFEFQNSVLLRKGIELRDSVLLYNGIEFRNSVLLHSGIELAAFYIIQQRAKLFFVYTNAITQLEKIELCRILEYILMSRVQ